MNVGPAAPAAVLDLYGPASPVINRYVDILADQGVSWGLIGPREVDRIWDRHILNSVAVASLVPTGARLVDVGSGAGLPGIPVAVLRPDLEVTLLEPLLRRSTFLSQAVATLGLADRVRVVRGRAEEHRDRYDVVVARAVAPLPRLLGWCLPLVGPAGSLLALKGRTAEEELATASPALRRDRLTAELLRVQAHADAEPTGVVRVRRAG